LSEDENTLLGRKKETGLLKNFVGFRKRIAAIAKRRPAAEEEKLPRKAETHNRK